MADLLVFSGALLTLLGFFVLFLFIKRLGILEMEAAMVNDENERHRLDPQPMVEVSNPFEINISNSNTLGCVEFTVKCINPCSVKCLWKLEKEFINKHVFGERNFGSEDTTNCSNLSTLLENECEAMLSDEIIEDNQERKISHNIDNILEGTQEDRNKFGTNSSIYDLVIVMQQIEDIRQENPCSISAMVVGISLKKNGNRYQSDICDKYILSANGRLFRMKKLYLEQSDIQTSEQHIEPRSQGGEQNLCIICQQMPISRALIPCGHACLCFSCFDKMNRCPMCRDVITSSFVLKSEPNLYDNNERQFSDILKKMNPFEIVRGIIRAS